MAAECGQTGIKPIYSKNLNVSFILFISYKNVSMLKFKVYSYGEV